MPSDFRKERHKPLKTPTKKDEDGDSILIWGLPKGLKQKFKARCALRRETMKSALHRMIRAYCEQD